MELIDKAAVVAEIEERKRQNLLNEGAFEEDIDILSFLNTIEVKEGQGKPVSDELEKVVEEIVDPTVLNAYGVKEIANRLRMTMIEHVSEDLNEAATLYVNDFIDGDIGLNTKILRSDCKISDAVNELETVFKAGAKWQKEQLMARGVDGVVHHFEKCKVASVHYNDPTGVPMAYFTSPEGLSTGGKVKIIVIKED